MTDTNTPIDLAPERLIRDLQRHLYEEARDRAYYEGFARDNPEVFSLWRLAQKAGVAS